MLGRLALARALDEDAAGHFEDAQAFCRSAGYRPELAWSLSDYADMLKERDGEGDREKAVPLLPSRWRSPASWACGRLWSGC